MAINIPQNQILARPVDAMYRGRALRMEERLAEMDLRLSEQRLRLGEQEIEQNEMALGAMKKPSIDEIMKIRDFATDRARQNLAMYEENVEKLGEGKAKEISQEFYDETRSMLIEMNPLMERLPKSWDATRARAALSGTVRSDDRPASIQEYEYYSQLPEDRQGVFMDLQRAPTVRDIGSVPSTIDSEGATPLSTLPQEAEGAQTIAQAQAAGRAAGQQGMAVPLTPGQEAADRAFADEYVAWTAAGGFADVSKNASQLNEAIQALESGAQLTGPYRGLAPDWLRNITNAKAVDTKELITEVVQRNLRLILGAQFTEREGERLISRAYNDQQEEPVNAARVKRLFNQILAAAEAKEMASRYFAENGTLAGYQGAVPSMGDFDELFTGSSNDSSGLVVRWEDLP